MVLANREPGSFIGFTRESATNFSTATLRPAAAASDSGGSVRIEEPADEPAPRPARRSTRRRSHHGAPAPAPTRQPPPKCPIARTVENWWSQHTPFHAKPSARKR